MNKNQEERNKFIDRWAEYVLANDDKKWSEEQNVIIDSQLRTTTLTKEQYLAMKKR